jgi:hypothetical protein
MTINSREAILFVAKKQASPIDITHTRDDLRADVFDYIERFYNPKRRHSTIGCLSPVQFENLLSA